MSTKASPGNGSLVQEPDNLQHPKPFRPEEKEFSDRPFNVRLAEINRTYPQIDLRPSRFASYWMKKVPTISWEPDLDICVDFFLRFKKLINESPDEAASVLLTFIRKHQIESDWSGWVILAAGWICLGFPEGFRTQGKPRATKFFRSYWTAVCSPKPRKQSPEPLLDSKPTKRWIDSRSDRHIEPTSGKRSSSCGAIRGRS